MQNQTFRESLERINQRLQRIWNVFTFPFFQPDSLIARRRVQLLSSLLLIFNLLLVISLVVSPFAGYAGERPFYYFILASLSITLPLYLLSRTKFYNSITVLILIFFSVFPFWAIIGRGDFSSERIRSTLGWLVAGFLLGVSLLSIRANLIVIALDMVAILLLPIFFPKIGFAEIMPALGFLLTTAMLIIANVRYRDLTEEDRRQEVLRTNRLSDDIIHGLPGIFLIYDEKEHLLRWNQKLLEITGYSAAEMMGRNMADFIKTEDPRVLQAFLTKIMIESKSETQVQLTTKDGVRIPYYLSAIRNTFGSETYTLCFGMDISNLKQTQEAYRAVVENSLQGLAIHQKHRIVFANPAYAQTLGYSVAELYAMDAAQVSNLIFVEDQPQVNLKNQADASGEKVKPRYETRVVCKDGSIRWLDVTTSRITYREKPALQIAAVDITDRKLMEKEQARLTWETENKNAELERFSYTVSHDLKSPLITIRGFLGFLEKDLTSRNVTRLKADVQRITEATDKMQRLLNDLLMLSRVGRVANPAESVSFQEIVSEAAERVSGQIRARGVYVKIAGNMPIVFVDCERIVEALQNLLDNAVKFMGSQPEAQIEVGFHGMDKDDNPILFVRDNGMGIDPQYHDQIFGLFNKLDPQSDGTGIGLALVKRIIEFHNGRIWVESQLGQGATFYFTLPVPNKRLSGNCHD